MSNPTSGQLSAREIFIAAVAITNPEQRDAFLDEHCGQDPKLRKIVAGMLAVPDAKTNPLDVMLDGFGTKETLVAVAEQHAGNDLTQLRETGPYKLLEQVGQGGFGTVYMAEQTAPVRRKVAVKILKPGMDSKEVIARFEAERQALAMMDHPNISRVIDGGTTKTGRPYFVMELVRGIPVTEYCDEARLTTEKRIKLFIDICKAVQHAHQKGIIHRDLKPSNVLVTMHDDKSVAKVIDFGIAKALNQQLTDRTLITGYQQMLGTPLYMSPEQAQMSGIDIDTRSDVYSLGVMLYELLTGTTPFDKESLSKASFDDLRKIIREQEPPHPSARITTLAAQARSTMADRRGIDQRRVSDELRGELDWIVMKALEKDRNRRYESASAFAADLQRYLDDEPVQACPPALGYRLSKYLKRHRNGVTWALVTVVAMTVCGGLLGYSRYQNGARISEIHQEVDLALREVETAIVAGDLALADKPIEKAMTLVSRDRAELPALAARVDTVAEELKQRHADQAHYHELLTNCRHAQDRMTLPDNSKNGLGQLPAHEAAFQALSPFGVLRENDWLQNLDASFLSPEQRLQVRETVYETLLCLADNGPRWVHTEESHNKSLEYLQQAESIHPPTKAVYWVRSECFRALQQTDACEAALAQYNATPATIALDYYLPGHTAGWRGDREAAIQAYQAALHMQPDHYNSLFFLADRMASEKHFEEAIAYFTGCVALRPNHAVAFLNRAEIYEKLGDKLSAEQDYRAATAESIPPVDRIYAFGKLLDFYWRTIQSEKHSETLAKLKDSVPVLVSEQVARGGWDNLDTLQLITDLGGVLCEELAFDEGIPLLKQVLAQRRALPGPPDAVTLQVLNSLGTSLTVKPHLFPGDGRDESIPLLEEALTLSRGLHGRDHKFTLNIMSNLGHAYARAGRTEQGVPLLEEAVQKLKSTDDTSMTLLAMSKLGEAYNDGEMWEKSVPLLEDTFDRHTKNLGADSPRTLSIPPKLAMAYEAIGQFDAGVDLLTQNLAAHQTYYGVEHPETATVMNNLGVALTVAKRPTEAIPLLTEALEFERKRGGPEDMQTLQLLHNLGEAYLEAEQFASGVDAFEKDLEIRTRLLGAEHPKSMEGMDTLQEAYRRAGRHEKGKQLANRQLEILRTQPDEIALSSGLAMTAEFSLTCGDYAEAEPLARECMQIREIKLPDNWLYFNSQSLLGGALVGLGRYDKAEPLLLKAIEGLELHEQELPSNARRHITSTIERLIQLYEATERPEEVTRWQARLQNRSAEQPSTE